MKITARHFGTLLDGTPVTLYTMAAENGAVVQVLDYGVTIRGITVPDRSGNPVDVALGYDTLEEYTRNDGYLGAVVGRFANRIAGGRFTLNGKEYRLACNDGDNHLHGGTALSGDTTLSRQCQPASVAHTGSAGRGDLPQSDKVCFWCRMI